MFSYCLYSFCSETTLWEQWRRGQKKAIFFFWIEPSLLLLYEIECLYISAKMLSMDKMLSIFLHLTFFFFFSSLRIIGIVIWKYLNSSKEWRGNINPILDKGYWCNHSKGYSFSILYWSIHKYIYLVCLCIYRNIFTCVLQNWKPGTTDETLLNPQRGLLVFNCSNTACLYSFVLTIPHKKSCSAVIFCHEKSWYYKSYI